MESQAALLLTSSSSCSPCSWSRGPHSPVVLRFSSLTLFSRPPISCSRSRISATLGDHERWLREEQRWLREEKRWLREEARWDAERRMMAGELALLKRELEQLRAQVEKRRAFSTGAATLPSVVASLKQLVESLPVEPRPDIEFVDDEEGELPESLSDLSPTFGSSEGPRFSSIPSMSEFSIDLAMDSAVEAARPISASFRELRNGAEGEEVKLLQEALAELGFYSGEEEMEYSVFSSDTETAVKSWQASIGVREDGVASPDLLAALFGKSNATEQNATSNGGSFVSHKGEQSDPWKAPSSAAASTGRDKKSFAEDTQDMDIASNRRVYLLGENRWEEPGRLGRPSSKANGAPLSAPTPASQMGTEEKCFSCKGEGVMMCTECEGTGELNVEDQFLDWVEEGAKCPYCEGSGAVTCDVCLGRAAVPRV